MSFTANLSEIVEKNESGLLGAHSTWARVPLGNVARVLNGFPFESKFFTKNDGVPLLRIRDILRQSTETRYCGPIAEGYWVEKGDLLVGMDGDFNCGIWRGASALLNQRVCKIIPDTGRVSPSFLFRALGGYLHAINAHTSSITVKHLSSRTISDIPLPYPPLSEQKRIARKLDSLLSNVDSCRARLDRVPQILKKFREAVLEAAVSGRLTEEWRADQPSLGSGLEVIHTIAATRRRLGLKSADRIVDSEGIDIPDNSIPECWAWCRVGQIADVQLGGTPSRAIDSYWNGDVPWVSSGEVCNRRIRSTRETITSDGVANSNAKAYPEGSVLIAMIGEGKTRGQSAILDIPASTNQNVAGLVFDGGQVNGEYVWLWALGQYEQTRSIGRGGNQPALNGAKVRALPIPVPPKAEQFEIVRRVDELFSVADTLKRRYDDAIARVDKLTPSVLAKAFRGELVPQDPNDEPAAEMLQRIRPTKSYGSGESVAADAGTRGRRSARPQKPVGGRRLRASSV